MAKSAKQYIEENDFEGALKRYDECYVRWQEHWFNTCYTIANNCKIWFDKYIFDPINKVIEKITKRKAKFQLPKSYTYLIKMYDENDNYVFTKCGKTNNLNRRFKELSKKHYKVQDIKISRIEVVKTWELPNDHLAESMENEAKAYFSQFFFHYPKDRFEPIEFIEDDFRELDKRYQNKLGLA